jgi:quinol monooxygenase YgiN
MIKHIVMWNVAGETAEQKRQAALFLKDRFEGLRGLIPGLRQLEIGVDISGVDYACDVVLYSEFENREALEAYASHPEHLRVRQEVTDIRTARYQVDYVFRADN